MIQQQYKNNVEGTSGEVQTTGFSIEVNESMFQMLTANVYNDPILAVIREWSTNACDACIAAGKEVKFDVHLPTLEKPTFAVRDYGTGLAPEDIVGLFSKLGASTKRGSNAYNGTFGIGRMAGLAVSNAFTVESFHEGTQYSYAVSMQKGVPVTLHMGNTPTTEPNGLKLSVSIDTNDIGYYRKKAEYLYKYFDHKPTLNRNDINVDLKVEENISENWFIQKPENPYERTNYVVMSQVPYAIPESHTVNNQGFRNLVIKAPAGSVSFNPGRESLSLDKATVAFLNTAFEKIADEYVAAATIAMANTSNDFELMKTYKSLFSTAPSQVAEKFSPEKFASKLYQNLFTNSTWSNTSKSFNHVATTTDFENDTNNTLGIYYKSNYYKTSKALKDGYRLDWVTFFYCNHVVVDLKTKFKKELANKFQGKGLVTWQRQGKEDLDTAVEHAKRYLDELGIEYKLASELVDVAETAPAAVREGLYVSDLSCSGMTKSAKMEGDPKEGTYLYLKMKHNTPDLPDGSKFTFEEYRDAYYMMHGFVKDLPPVKGVAKKYQGIVEDLDNWVDFSSYIEEKMKQLTFKTPPEEYPEGFSNGFISPGTAHLYPKDIKEYYEELNNYVAFRRSKDYISENSLITLAKSFGSSLESYEWPTDKGMSYLKTKYPKTMDLMTGVRYLYRADPTFVQGVAKLEEFYAIHSSK